MPPRLAALALALLLAVSAQAAGRVKVGLVSTLSGASAGPGVDIRDGFRLALRHLGGKLGGGPAELVVADDQQDPERGRQAVAAMVARDKVDFLTGIVFSDILLAAAPTAFAGKTFYISAGAGPSEYAGSGCSPFFFSVAGQNDALPEAIGKHVQDKGFRNVVMVVPDYPGGRDAVAGFKRYYRGRVAAEIHTRLGQLYFGVEIAHIRALKPDALFFFLPGGMGSNFVKQFAAAGLAKEIQLFAPGFSADEDVIKAVGSPMLGLFNSAAWGHDLDNPENRRFVADFARDYGRVPSLFAAQGYDAAMLIDAAVRDVNGRLGDKAGVQKALEAARFKSVRGEFRFNGNHYPVQRYYLRVVGKDPGGRLTNRTLDTIFTDHPDAYREQCPLP